MLQSPPWSAFEFCDSNWESVKEAMEILTVCERRQRVAGRAMQILKGSALQNWEADWYYEMVEGMLSWYM